MLTNNTSQDVSEVCALSRGEFLPNIYTENIRLMCSKLAKRLSNEVIRRHCYLFIVNFQKHPRELFCKKKCS